jgi:hypothetical protein
VLSAPSFRPCTPYFGLCDTLFSILYLAASSFSHATTLNVLFFFCNRASMTRFSCMIFSLSYFFDITNCVCLALLATTLALSYSVIIEFIIFLYPSSV